MFPGKNICPNKRLKETLMEDTEELEGELQDSELDEVESSFHSDVSKEHLNSELAETFFSFKNSCC